MVDKYVSLSIKWLLQVQTKLWIRLDTTYFAENWKYYSKIIFKYVNSIVDPVNSTWTVLFVFCIVNPCAWTVQLLFIHVGEKKNRKKRQMWRKNVNSNTHYGSVWIEFIFAKTKNWNWKYCNEIIFKCVNNVMGSILMKKLLKSEVCGSVNSTRDPLMCWKWLKSQNFRLLFMHSTWTVALSPISREKKKKKKGKRKRGKRRRRIQLNPNGHYKALNAWFSERELPWECHWK